MSYQKCVLKQKHIFRLVLLIIHNDKNLHRPSKLADDQGND